MEALTEDLVEEVFGLMKLNMQSLFEERNGPWDDEKIRKNFIGHNCILVKRKGSVAGFSFYELKENEIYIHTLQISPEYQHRTMGGQFFKWFRNLAASTNSNAISCRVYDSNPAYGLYKRIGFEEVSTVEGLVEMVLPLAHQLKTRRSVCSTHR